MREKQTNLKSSKAITLIALVITIVVLLILAGITVATLTGDNGLLTKAGQAKTATEIAEEKDIISTSAIQAQSENRYANLEESKFREALNTNSKTGNKASIIAEDIGSFTVKFESNRYYEVDKSGNIGYIENVTGEKTLTVQCVNSNDEVLGEYEYLVLTDRYSKLPPAIDKYESSQEKIEGEITENKTIQVLYYLICNDDTTLVFTGLNSNGNITTNENEIESYMVGDGNNTAEGNGLKEKTIQSVLYIPEKYIGKPVIKVGQNAFARCYNLKKIIIGDCVTILCGHSFYYCNKVETIVLGKKVTTFEGGSYPFMNCSNVTQIIFRTDTLVQNWGLLFNGCAMNEIILDGNEDIYKVEDNVLYSKDGTVLSLFPENRGGTFTIPSSVVIIGEAFAKSSLTSVIISDSVTTINQRAFNAASIAEVKIGQKVNSIGSNAFMSCSNLRTVIIDSSVVASGLTSNNAMGRFMNNATTIYIKNDISTIGSYVIANYSEETSDKEGYVKYVKK